MNIWPKLPVALMLQLGLVGAAMAQSQDISSQWQNGNETVVFPALSDSYFNEPATINSAQQLNLVDAGMNKEQVWRKIGRPHFKEGAFGVRVWNYAFRFRQADGAYQVCQYQIHFNNRPVVDKLYTNCPAIASKPKNSKSLTVAADGMFAFGRSGVQDISAVGMSKIRNFAENLNSAYSQVDSIRIVGHTDAIGSDSANMQLSLARAQTIGRILAGLGIANGLIHTEGRGESEPIVNCGQGNTSNAAMVNCLAPNRRVTIEVIGLEK